MPIPRVVGTGARLAVSTDNKATWTELPGLLPGFVMGTVDVGEVDTSLLEDIWNQSAPSTFDAGTSSCELQYLFSTLEYLKSLLGVFNVDENYNMFWRLYDRAGPYANTLDCEGYIKSLEPPTFSRTERPTIKLQIRQSSNWELTSEEV